MPANYEQAITLTGDLHARPAGALAVAAARFSSAVSLTVGTSHADAKSVLGVMGLGATSGQHITVTDITHGRCMLLLIGQDAPNVLRKVCGLDFGDVVARDADAVGGTSPPGDARRGISRLCKAGGTVCAGGWTNKMIRGLVSRCATMVKHRAARRGFQ